MGRFVLVDAALDCPPFEDERMWAAGAGLMIAMNSMSSSSLMRMGVGLTGLFMGGLAS
jgi:hypothetical protein